MGVFDTTFQWVLNNKITTLLGIITFSFLIATIAVAVEKTNLSDELEICETMLNLATSSTEMTTTETTIIPTSSTEDNPDSSSTTEPSTPEPSTPGPNEQVYIYMLVEFMTYFFFHKIFGHLLCSFTY